MIKQKILATLIILTISLHAFAFWKFSPTKAVPSRENFIVLNDIHLDVNKNTLMFIDPIFYGYNNDLDKATFLKLLETTQKSSEKGIIPKPKFILFLGDIACHKSYRKPELLINQASVFRALKTYFPATPIFYIFGNGDSLIKNYGPFASQDGLKSPYQIAKANGWADGFLSSGKICDKDNTYPCIMTEDINHGYYSAFIHPKLKLIALNSVLFAIDSRGDSMGKNAKDELNWLSQQLQAARAGKTAVLIAMHIPPGNDVFTHQNFWKASYKKTFINLVSTYRENIIGILAAHTHMDEVKVLHDKKRKNLALVILSPALSTMHGNASAIKSFTLSNNHGSWLLSNYETFRFINAAKNTFSFKKVYDYNSYYCANKQANNMFDCAANITADRVKKYYTAGNPNFSGVMLSPEDFIVE
jgi:sphingomyelin phosphodiesterase acid-like 3